MIPCWWIYANPSTISRNKRQMRALSRNSSESIVVLRVLFSQYSIWMYINCKLGADGGETVPSIVSSSSLQDSSSDELSMPSESSNSMPPEEFES